MASRLLKGIHWPVLTVALILTLIGIFTIYSASFRVGGGYANKQFNWMFVSMGIFAVTVWIGYRPFLNVAYLLYGFTLTLLIAVLLFGDAHFGANRWISIGPLVLQPSELAKIATVIVLAHYLGGRTVFSEQKRSLFMATTFVAVPVFLIIKQPDLGSSIIFLPVLVTMVFIWGVRLRYLVVTLVSGLLSLPILWHFLKPYQQKRLLVFFNPSIDPIGASYTAIQSKIAVGSGSLVGKGWLQGTQTQLDFVPEHHTDFIFSVLGEEFGFMGTVAVVALFAVLIYHVFDIMDHTTDLRAKLLAQGIATMLCFQAFVNMGMTFGLMPITGLTLPFVSYGGSSLVSIFFSMGLLVSIYKERSIF
jgi:rod shape determining protein RodA